MLCVAIAACAFIPILCGILFSFVAVDTNYHMGSWTDMLSDWHAGVLLPGWAAHANYGLGDPRFCFYPPVPMFIGALGLLLLPTPLVMGVLFFATFFVAGLCMYSLSRRLLDRQSSAIAAILYTLSYFLLITALKHGAVAELMVDAFLPLILAYFLEILYRERAHSWVRLTLTLALAWVIDVPVAVEIAYTLTIACVLIALSRRSATALLKVLAAEVAAVFCADFYLLPAFLAQHTVFSAARLEFKVRTLFVSRVMQDFTLSADALVLALVIAWFFYRRRADRTQRPVLVILMLGLISFFFQLPISRVFWLHLPELRIVGFPHRFQVFLAIAFPLAILLKGNRRILAWASIAVYLLLALFPFYGFRQWVHRSGPLETARQIVHRSQGGYAGAPEYVPIHTGALWLDNTNKAIGMNMPLVRSVANAQPTPDAQLSTDDRSAGNTPPPAAGSPCALTIQRWNPESRAIAVQGPACTIALKLYLHPFWHFAINGQPVSAIAGYLGTANLQVPAGRHTVTATFRRPLIPVLLGWAITLVSVVFVLLVGRRTRAGALHRP